MSQHRRPGRDQPAAGGTGREARGREAQARQGSRCLQEARGREGPAAETAGNGGRRGREADQ